jgi:hypothetical protein
MEARKALKKLAARLKETRLFRLWLLIGEILGWVNTRILLAIIFFAILTPISLLRRIFVRDPLHLKWNPELPSYVTPVAPREPAHFRFQF